MRNINDDSAKEATALPYSDLQCRKSNATKTGLFFVSIFLVKTTNDAVVSTPAITFTAYQPKFICRHFWSEKQCELRGVRFVKYNQFNML
jgi:hypothetical protein